jgi:quinoprotein glucose dehydrogenase
MKILTKRKGIVVLWASGFLITLSLIVAWVQPIDEDNGWGVYKADEKSTSYSKFDQINVSNVSTLQNAWTFQMNDVPAGEQPLSSQSNPIIVDGVMYANSGK